MIQRIIVVLVVIFASCELAGAREPVDDSLATIRILVPAYSYPAGEGLKFWDQLIAAASRVPIVAIANANSGPGKKRDDNYAAVITRAQQAGVKVIGYVATGYAKRQQAAVARDIDRWTTFYPSIQGVFFDEQASQASGVTYYSPLAKHARRKIDKPLIVSNPGTICDRAYVTCRAFDVICLFENSRGYDRFRVPEFGLGVGHTKFAALVHGTAAVETMKRYARMSSANGITYLYVTDDTGENPWDKIASYWQQELAAIQQSNAGKSLH